MLHLPAPRLQGADDGLLQLHLQPAPGLPRPGVATARQLQGKDLSYNNLNDTDAAFELVAEFDPARAAAVASVSSTR